jgi:hypothetical protein
MDILPPALDCRTNTTADSDDPEFTELVERVTGRLSALGTPAAQAIIRATVLEVIQDVAHFTLAWAEPADGADAEGPEGRSRKSDNHSNETINAERRW